jgi:hypothetical protein
VAELSQAEEESRHIQVSFHWSPGRAVSPEIQHVKYVELDPARIRVIREAGRELQEQSTIEGFEAIGLISALARDINSTAPGTVAPGTVKIHTLVNGRQRIVTMRLDPESADHRMACDAYRDDRTICVTGRLVRRGQSLQLEEPQGFEMLP